jgi:hypothetical protein
MKSLILAALLCAALISRSQEIIFQDSIKIPQVVSTIVTEIPGYQFVKVDSSKNHKSFKYIYSNGIKNVWISFSVLNIGGNKDLEIPDTVYYKLVSVIGPYKALFPYWKKYFQPNADLINLQKDGHGELIIRPYIGKKEFVCTFTNSSGWWITFNMY